MKFAIIHSAIWALFFFLSKTETFRKREWGKERKRERERKFFKVRSLKCVEKAQERGGGRKQNMFCK